ALAALAAVLVAFCFTRGAREEATAREVEAPGASAPESPDGVAVVSRKVVPPSLIALSPGEQQKVDEALARGVAYLKKAQNADGSWYALPNYRVGPSALAALTLVECGVPVDDPCITKATPFIRNGCRTLTKTYELSLALLFLNRLGDGADRDRIQQLALRLVAGQLPSGGWAYDCPIL